MIAIDRRRSQTIAEDRTWFHLLRLSAITIAGSKTIAELFAICDPRSSTITPPEVYITLVRLPNWPITARVLTERYDKNL